MRPSEAGGFGLVDGGGVGFAVGGGYDGFTNDVLLPYFISISIFYLCFCFFYTGMLV